MTDRKRGKQSDKEAVLVICFNTLRLVGIKPTSLFLFLAAVLLLAKCWLRTNLAANRFLRKSNLDGNAWFDCGSQGVRLLTLAVLPTKSEGLTIPPGFVSRMAPPNLKIAHVCKVLEFVGKTEFIC